MKQNNFVGDETEKHVVVKGSGYSLSLGMTDEGKLRCEFVKSDEDALIDVGMDEVIGLHETLIAEFECHLHQVEVPVWLDNLDDEQFRDLMMSYFIRAISK